MNSKNAFNLTVSNMLSLQLETSLNTGTYYGSVLQGWFIPPTTARYRFYMTCDDTCILKLGNASYSLSNITTLLNVGSWCDYRYYWKTNDNV